MNNIQLSRPIFRFQKKRLAVWLLASFVSTAVMAQKCLVGETSPTAPVRQLFVVAGQSNAVGLASVRDVVGGAYDPAQRDTLFRNVKIYGIYGAPSGVAGKDDGALSKGVQWSRFASWHLAQPGFGYKNVSLHANQFPSGVTAKEVFGPELFLARYLNERKPRDHYIVKLAVSNTSLGTVGGLDNWAPGGQLNNELLQMIADAYNSQKSKVKLRVAGLFWMQGETDALNEESARQYKKNLIEFTTKFRQAIVRMQCSSDSNVPVVIGRIQDNPLWTYRKDVRLAQMQVVRDLQSVSLVDTDDFFNHLVVGGVHFDEIAQARLGERFFKALFPDGSPQKKE